MTDLEPSPAELGDTMTVAPGEWTPLDDHGTEIYLYGDRPADIAIQTQPNLYLMRMALELIGTKCANFTSGSCVEEASRSPYAQYLAGRWCDQCIARAGLEGLPFPYERR